MKNQMNNQSKPQKKSLSDKIGDGLEKIGHKLSRAGAPKMGQKIHDLGDKLEKNHRNPKHPHKA